MRKFLLAALLAGPLGACGYFPVAPDPIRIVDSPADVFSCRRLGVVGDGIRTDGRAPYYYSQQTLAVRAGAPATAAPIVGTPETGGGENFAERLNLMRDRALQLGASDLLLTRRFGRDWAYVTGTAYFCRH